MKENFTIVGINEEEFDKYIAFLKRLKKEQEKIKEETKEKIKKLLSEVDDLCAEYDIDLYYDGSYLHIGNIHFSDF